MANLKLDCEKNNQPDLPYQAENIEKMKIPMLGFVSCDKHRQITARRAAYHRKTDKRRFGDTPLFLYGAAFIHRVQNKGDQGYCAEYTRTNDCRGHNSSFLPLTLQANAKLLLIQLVDFRAVGTVGNRFV